MLDALGVLVARPASVIKSIQYGTVTILANALTGTATITSVTIGKAVLIPLGATAAGGGGPIASARMTLTNATTVTATFILSIGSDAVTGFVVVEFR